MSTDRNEALRLADELAGDQLYGLQRRCRDEAAALLRQQAEQIDQLRAEVERLRPNAERYVYLRDVHHSLVPHDSLIGFWVFSRPTATALAFDESIDHARTTHKETE